MTDFPRKPPLKRVLAEFRPYRRTAGLGVGATVVQTVCASLTPVLVGVAIDRGVVAGQGIWILGSALAYLGLLLVQGGAVYVQVRTMGRFAQEYMRDLRSRLLDHLFALDLDFFTRERSGRLVSRLTSDVENLQQFVGGGLALLVEALLVLVLTIVLMVTLSVPLTLVALLIVPPLLMATIVFQRQAFAAQLEVRDSVANLLTRLNESLIGIRVVQAYNVEEAQRRAFGEVNEDAYRARMGMARVSARYYPIVEFLHPVALAAVLGYGALLAVDGRVPVGVVVAFTLYVGRLFQPIQQFTELAHLLQAAAASFAKVFAFQDEQPRVSDAADARPLEPGPGEVRLEGVSFRYGPGQPLVIQDVDLTIAPGERVALVGGSGAGKSTIAKLMARFYELTSGRILIDGQDVSRVTGESLRRHLALVPQEGFLFDGTIADNIAAARPEAAHEEIEEAASAIGLERALASLAGGLDTEVANRGLSLSAGQRQLVALARAFLAGPRILILDEATSSLDPATEAVVEEALRTLLAGRTAVVIAHRLRTALRADRVVMLEGGRILEAGSPAELMAAGGAFARWVRSVDDPMLAEDLRA